jgi:hypothetical protein
MTYANLMITFILGGLWHGAGWTFIFWGFLHGAALVIHRLWSTLGFKLWSWIAWFITFNFINIAWVFFRAKEWDDALKVLHGMFSFDLLLPASLSHKLAFLTPYGVQFGGFIENVQGDLYTIIWILIAFALVLFFKNSNQLIPKKLNLLHAFFSSILLVIAIYSLGNKSEFLYFNF